MGTAPGKFVEGGRGITVDGQGDVWIGDMPNFRAQQFTASGGLIGVYPNPAQPPVKGGFTMPGRAGPAQRRRHRRQRHLQLADPDS